MEKKYRLLIHWLIKASLSVWLVSKAIFKLNKSRSYKLWRLSRSRLVGSSLLTELLNWPWARAKLPLKLKYGKSFNRDLFNFCCCLVLVFVGISIVKLDYFVMTEYKKYLSTYLCRWSFTPASEAVLNFLLSSERSANL